MPKVQPGPRKDGRGPRDDESSSGVWEGRLRLWIDIKGRVAFGPGKMRLLRAIAETKSLSAAAKQLRMSYRLAWKHLKILEERTGLTVVEPQRGGSHGGGSALTLEGKALLKAYDEFHREVDECVRVAVERHFKPWSPTRSAENEA